MMLKVFAVYDLKAKHFATPFFMNTIGEAVRGFADVANDNSTTIFRHPSDYILFQIGDLDGEKGLLLPLDKHVHLGLASDFVERKSGLESVVKALNNPTLTAEELSANGGR